MGSRGGGQARRGRDGDAGESFESLYRRLEEGLSRLEQGGLTLEESLSLYEEGMKLARRCQQLLEEAELRVSRLQEQFAEDIRELRDEVAEYQPQEPPAEDELPLD